MVIIDENTELGRMLDWVRRTQASDLHCQTGRPFHYRKGGRLVAMPNKFKTATENRVTQILKEAFDPDVFDQITKSKEFDIGVAIANARFRGNFSKQQGLQSFSFRMVPRQTLKLADLCLPMSLFDLTKDQRGLVLVTGPIAQGKTTTACALIEEMNQREALRIIAIEDPVEFLFDQKMSMIEQREVGIDTASFGDGVRNALRQDPDVIFIGEIRDAESAFATMRAVETGCLILATLHADTVAQAIERVREFYPARERDMIGGALGRNLNCIVCQRLVPERTGRRLIPCLEILRRDAGVADAIARNDLKLLHGIIESSTSIGMHTFDQYLRELVVVEAVTAETALQYAVNRHRLELELSGIETNQSILKPN